jgi:hypothetical protein
MSGSMQVRAGLQLEPDQAQLFDIVLRESVAWPDVRDFLSARP